jgi:quinolinate synthase
MEKLESCLRTEQPEIFVQEPVRKKAVRALNAMLKLSAQPAQSMSMEV